MKSAQIYLSGQDLISISKGTRGNTYDHEDNEHTESTYPYNKVHSI